MKLNLFAVALIAVIIILVTAVLVPPDREWKPELKTKVVGLKCVVVELKEEEPVLACKQPKLN